MVRPRKARPDRYRLRFFGRKLQELTRRAADDQGITQGEVAKQIGVTADQLSRWILGHAHPSEEEFPKLASLPGASLEEFDRLEELDKLDYYRRSIGMESGDLNSAAKAIATEEKRSSRKSKPWS